MTALAGFGAFGYLFEDLAHLGVVAVFAQRLKLLDLRFADGGVVDV